MAVRIKVRLKHGSITIDTIALASSGYEGDEPEIHIPLALGRRLGFTLEGVLSERYRVVGSEATTYILGYVFVALIVDSSEYGNVRARAVTVPGEYEVILNDHLIEALNIELVKPASGIWRISGEETLRRSFPPQYWVS